MNSTLIINSLKHNAFMLSFDKKILITRLGVDKVKPKGWFYGVGDFGHWD